ncbi:MULTISPECIES: hypothetical protein [unclassified Caballeronia]|uniref:hypothetical protein n=1 Tax=unclassified Caballeronia TaxID=2646786 RepID=UPI002028C40A|nr:MULTISPECIES: hypothetical protein [unclassified Caballeronia]
MLHGQQREEVEYDIDRVVYSSRGNLARQSQGTKPFRLWRSIIYERDAHIKRAEGERILVRQLQRVSNTADDDEFAAVTNSLSI